VGSSASFEAYGFRIGVRANNARALHAVVANLPPPFKHSSAGTVDLLYSVVARDPKSTSDSSALSSAYVNGMQLVRSPKFDDIPNAVESHLSIELAQFAKDRVFIHAGVVGWKEKAILMPGRSLAGKSTLVASLLRTGAVYYSDEFAVVDRLGYVYPYARPLQLRNGRGTTYIPAAELRALIGRKSLPVGLVLMTQYRRGASWRPRRLSPGEGLLAVLANTVSAQAEPERALKTLAAMLARALVLSGPRGEAEKLIARLRTAGYLAA
jgi:hypothetical protein